MRDIINFCLKVLVLMVATELFPNKIQSDGIKGIIVAVLLMTVIGIVYLIGLGLLTGLFSIMKESAFSTIGLIACIFGILATNITELYFVSTYYEGFNISGGFEIYFLLALVLSIFSIKAKDNKKNSVKRTTGYLGKCNSF